MPARTWPDFNRKKVLIATSVIVIALVFATAAGFYFSQNKNKSMSDGYRAIFLDNNQVYFAKIKDMGGEYVTIADVYYFGRNNGQSGTDDIVLVKLGSEVHGPTDEMKILGNHILYIEKLSDDSRVLQAITEYKNKN